MKKISIGIMLGLCLALLFSFKTLYDIKNNTAEVEIIDGIYIYAYSKPVKEYKITGNLQLSFKSQDYNNVFQKLTKKIKKSHPTANGLVMHVENDGAYVYADIIEIK